MEDALGTRDSSTPDLRDLYRYMASREFVASRAELLQLGFGPHRLRSWKRSGRLVKSFRGIYAYGREVHTRNAALRAALLVAGPGSALTGRVALEKWGAIKTWREIPLEVEVATRTDRDGIHRGLSPCLRNTRVKVVQRQFAPVDVRTRDGLRILRAALALIDFAVSASETEVRFAFLELCRLRCFSEEDVEFCVRRAVGRRGSSKIKPLLGLWVAELERIRSVLEGLFLLAWVEAKLEMPEVNVKIHGYEVDFLWRRKGVVLELDGDAFHSDPIAMQRDLSKQRFLESKGMKVIRVTWKEFQADSVGVVNRIACELDLV